MLEFGRGLCGEQLGTGGQAGLNLAVSLVGGVMVAVMARCLQSEDRGALWGGDGPAGAEGSTLVKWKGHLK